MFRASAVNTDLAKSAVMTASSSAAGSSPSAVNDGDPGTVWTSGSGGTGEWLQADLGTVQPVNDVLVQWGHSYSPDYTVELSSNGTTYTTVGHSGAPGNSSTARTRFATTAARYVRLRITGYPAGVTSFDVAGFQVRNQRAVQPKPTLIKTRYPTADAVVADFDATAYGADPKAVRDSTKAIQAALYDCYDAGGGTVWLPDGSYRVTDTVEVPAFCTLRGDHRDPDQGHGGYGTVVNADFPPGDNGPVLLRIGGSAGVVGVTTFYPRQNATNPVPYNYMMSTVSDVTMLNSYRGITISTMADERGRPPAVGQTHESATVRNVSGTALLEGVAAFNGADVGTWENVKLSNAYWADAPAAYHPPKRAALDAWTRVHGTGFIFGDLEWDQFFGLSAADYHIGIRVVKGQRADFTGVFPQTRIVRTDTALQVEQFDARWGLSLAPSDLEGSVAAVDNRAPGGYVKVTGTKLVGAVIGTVHQLAGTVPGYDQKPAAAKPARAVLYDVSKAPYNTPRGNGYTPAQDATPRIQLALDRAKHDGGGVVYLPAGWYRLDGHLVVPAGVELRGASPVPNRDEDGRSGGTVLMSYADGTFVRHGITVDGARGLTVFDVFGYGLHNGLIVNSGDVRVFNQGTDNLGTDGFTVKVASGNVSVVNLMRYNGTTSTGPVKLVNIMVINIVEHRVTAAVAPAGSGSVALAGNETLPGGYEQGSQVTASAKAAPGFSFVNWTVGGTEVSTNPAYTFTVTGDVALTANFTPV